MLVVTLVLAAIGFGLLVIALMTGSVLWAWGCIVVCALGGVLLLASALGGRTPTDGDTTDPRPASRRRSDGRNSSDR
ncbi:hypothetical protein OED52_12135 [Rhodococcus sp. Z13]|uniref:Uncharacterized protein n=1 Tax=Rhodococcus sacchari TaxID=2962047 RepID=A0ACD4DBM5_9NOCA|nr:hypothetical protein [Rhodococcus sp. Z13]UYP17453.1 hypothetical protein OED52_12135 [Rhodococcus sp. Z13]